VTIDQPGDGRSPKTDEARRELGQYGERLDALRDRPVDLLDALRADGAFARAFAHADAVVHLREWFSPAGGWSVNEERSGVAGPGGVVVEWRYEGTHDRDGAFNGLMATGRPVVVRGVTMVGLDAGGVKLHRYVDWAGLYAQLGLTLNWRQPVSGAPPSR
jgi:hypothetical protein